MIAWLRYAGCLHELGASEDALAATRWCMEPRSVQWLAHRLRGRIFGDLGRSKLAIEEYEAALRLKKRTTTLIQLAGELADAGRSDEAITHLEEAVALGGPCVEEAHKNLGYYLASKNETARSKAHLARALAIDPNYPEAQAALGRTLLLAHESAAAARALLVRALDAKPGMLAARVYLAWAEWDLGNLPRAEELLTDLVARCQVDD